MAASLADATGGLRQGGGGRTLGAPRMRMPVSYTSARFVGREAAFARLAAGLDDAAHGRTTTLLARGTAGIGVTRFLDEAIVRIDALTSR